MTDAAVARIVGVAKAVYPAVARPACALKLYSEVRAAGRAAADSECRIQGNPIQILRSACSAMEGSGGLERLHATLLQHISQQMGVALGVEAVDGFLSTLQEGQP
jgi:hypothetical protein